MKTLKTLIQGILLILAVSANAQVENSTLWEVSGNGLEKSSFLFGTIHAVCADDLQLPPKVKAALQQSEQLVLELDMDSPLFMEEIQKLSINENMQNISSLLSSKDLILLNAYFTKHYGADMSQLGIMKPFTLMSMMVLKSLDCSEPASYEGALMAYAQEKQWEVLGLEKIQEQLDVFNSVSIEEQLDWLVTYAEKETAYAEDLKKLIEVYQSEDINKLLSFMGDYPEYKIIEDELLYDRNEKWITSIASLAEKIPTFFAVGAAHLASAKNKKEGELGLIDLLRKEGFIVNPIMAQ